MPFVSDSQRRYLFAKHPSIANRWVMEAKRNKIPVVAKGGGNPLWEKYKVVAKQAHDILQKPAGYMFSAMSPLEVGTAALIEKSDKPLPQRLMEQTQKGGDIIGALESRNMAAKYAIPLGLAASIAIPGAGELSAIKKAGLIADTAKDVIKAVAKKTPKIKVVAKSPLATEAPKYKSAEVFDTKTTGMTNYDEFLGNKPFEGAGGYKTVKEYLEKYKGKTGQVVQMTPDEYLAQIPESKPTQSSIDFMKNKLSKGEKLPMATLDTSGGGLTQEGRNRAYLAKEMGLETMPVLKVTSTQAKGGVGEP